MPAVPANHGWIDYFDAVEQLKAAGLLTEYAGPDSLSCGSLYVRTSPNGPPSRMNVDHGRVSPRTVARLIKRLQSSS
jgi:hypothetical protein